jgi:crotonobetainyl-CoA:carnitine CoA-transferase CaiB-like acyl-CoA transferase
VALALSGFLSLVRGAPGDISGPPIRPRGELTSAFAGLHATVAALGALHARLVDGHGQRLDVAALEAMVGTLAISLPQVTYAGVVPVPGGSRGVCPWNIFTCRDGRFVMQCTEDRQWRALVEILGNPEWGLLEVFETTAQRVEQVDVVEQLVQDAVAEFTLAEFLARARELGVPASPVHTPQEVLGWEHLQVRGAFRTVDAAGTAITAPTPPIRFADVAAAPCVTAPVAEGAAVAWSPRSGQPAPAPAAAPLAGLRVIDLTWVWAGPFAAMQLAHLGADVIKVESRDRVDVTRRLAPFADGEPGVNRSGYFNQYNQGKRSIVLDLGTKDGRDVLARLLQHADVVIDNMRAGALARMGFDDARLRELNPRLVAVAMTGYGETGPERDKLAYGALIDALSGMTFLTGPVDGDATEIALSLPDPNAGLHAAIGALAGLYRARTSGVGADIECSMLEAWIAAMPSGVLTTAATDEPPGRVGTRDEQMSPHGAFRAAGPNAWVALVVEDDERFAALAGAIGAPELATDPRFATLAARQHHEAELEAIVAAWVVGRERDDAVTALTAAGVTAAAVRTMDEVVACPHLAARDFYLTPEHPEVGRRRVAGPPWRATRSPMHATTAAPLLGEHTEAVLRDAGFDDAAIADLAARGIVG